jgi:hypothetical protein
LRALLLCQRVYFGGDTWAKMSEPHGDSETVTVIPVFDNLRPDWKMASLNYWKTKTEAEIQQGIAMFDIVPGATATHLQHAAFAGPPNGTPLPGNVKLSRAKKKTVGEGVTCYVGVQGWLVRSGLVSMRWFQRNSAPNGKIGCTLLFGEGRKVWDDVIKPEDEPAVRKLCKAVERGSIVHIYSPQNNNWNGHWVIANGDEGGTICGVNNGDFEAEDAEMGEEVGKPYTRTSTLYEQFCEYCNSYRLQDDFGEPTGEVKWTKAVMVVIDPLQLPNRM